MNFFETTAQDFFDNSFFLAESVWKVIVPQYFFWTLMLAFAIWLFARAAHKDAHR